MYLIRIHSSCKEFLRIKCSLDLISKLGMFHFLRKVYKQISIKLQMTIRNGTAFNGSWKADDVAYFLAIKRKIYISLRRSLHWQDPMCCYIYLSFIYNLLKQWLPNIVWTGKMGLPLWKVLVNHHNKSQGKTQANHTEWM